MSNIENEIRDALRDRSGDVARTPGALGQIERGVVRARRRRAAAVGFAVVVALVASGTVATRLLSSNDPSGFIGPTGDDPKPTPTLSVEETTVGGEDTETLPWQHSAQYFDRRGFYVAYPEDFERTEWEGVVEIRVPGLPSLAQGEPTWGVAYAIEAGAHLTGRCEGTQGSATIRHEQVPWCETRNGAEYRRTYTFTWADHPCDHPELGCTRRDGGVTVTARIIAGNRELWDQHLEHGEKIVGTTRRSQSDPHGYREPQESVAPSPEQVTEAQATDLSREFLAARVRGEGAETYLTATARREVTDLYDLDDRDYISYDIGEVMAADANSWQVSVQLFFNASKTQGVHEILFVGPDEGRNAVRGVQREAVFTD